MKLGSEAIRRSSLVLPTCAAAAFLMYACCLLLADLTPKAAAVIGGVIAVVVSLATVIVVAGTMRTARAESRAAWAALLAATVVATFCVAAWAGSYAFGWYRLPPWGLAGYLLFPVCFAMGLLLFPGGVARAGRFRAVLDGVLMGASLLIVSWLAVMRHIAEGDLQGYQLILALAYPIADVVALTVATTVLIRAPRGARPTLTALTLGLFLMTMLETVFAYVSLDAVPVADHLYELTWTAGMIAILSGALIGRTADFDQRPGEPWGWVSAVLPYLLLTLAASVMAVQPFNAMRETPVLVATAALIPAALLRQFVAVAENNRLVATVTEQSLRDPLTGLANRTRFAQRLAEMLDSRDSDSAAVVVLDLDGFKAVNDRYGHAAGDELLVAVADRIRREVDDSVTVARLGGDEFAVAARTSAQQAQRLGAQLSQALETPFLIEGQQVLIGACVGVAVASPTDTATDGGRLLKRADLSMYAAKRSRSSHLVETQGSEPAGLAEQLREAIASAGFILAYQPKVGLDSGAVVGVEALLRWAHPEYGLLLPGQFLPLVRSEGLMEQITELVLRLALDDVRRWRNDGLDVPVAVNVFAPSLADPSLPGRVAAEVSRRGLRPDILTLELTEDLPLGRIGPTKLVLAELRGSGVRIALDDFGTGHSSLSYLCHLPVDEVKLDRNFLGPWISGVRVESVVRGTVGMARELGLTTVAEGVADRKTFERAADLGFDIAQGNYLGDALPAAQVPTLFANRRVAPWLR